MNLLNFLTYLKYSCLTFLAFQYSYASIKICCNPEIIYARSSEMIPKQPIAESWFEITEWFTEVFIRKQMVSGKRWLELELVNCLDTGIQSILAMLKSNSNSPTEADCLNCCKKNKKMKKIDLLTTDHIPLMFLAKVEDHMWLSTKRQRLLKDPPSVMFLPLTIYFP